MKIIKRMTAIAMVVVLACAFSVNAYATVNKREINIPNKSKLKVWMWIQSSSDSDGSGEYKADAELITKKSVKNSKISITTDFYIHGIAASVSYVVGVSTDGATVSSGQHSWSKKNATYVRTPIGARVYGHGLWWYIGYTAFADLSIWGENYQTSAKI